MSVLVQIIASLPNFVWQCSANILLLGARLSQPKYFTALAKLSLVGSNCQSLLTWTASD